jgi:hypothetical protein
LVEEESREIGGQATAVRAGTEGSNPACSSGESVSVVNTGAVGENPRSLAAVCEWLGT